MEDQVDVGVLAKLVEGSGVQFKHGRQSYIFTCPKCDTKKKLYIRKSDGRFKCFKCDAFQGRAEYALAELLGRPVGEIQGQLYGIAPTGALALQLQDHWCDDLVEEELEFLDEVEPAVFPYHFYELAHRFCERGRGYLAGRGLSLEVCAYYGLRYSPVTRRVVFPVTMGGVLWGWQARTVDNLEPKILTSNDLPRDRSLMFWDQARDAKQLIVTEGPVDALKCHLAGGGQPTMGKSISRQQVQLILQHPAQDVYVALDPDAAEETARLVRDLSEKRVYFLEPARGYKDLGEMSQEEVLEQKHVAQRVTSSHLFMYLG